MSSKWLILIFIALFVVESWGGRKKGNPNKISKAKLAFFKEGGKIISHTELGYVDDSEKIEVLLVPNYNIDSEGAPPVVKIDLIQKSSTYCYQFEPQHSRWFKCSKSNCSLELDEPNKDTKIRKKFNLKRLCNGQGSVYTYCRDHLDKNTLLKGNNSVTLPSEVEEAKKKHPNKSLCFEPVEEKFYFCAMICDYELFDLVHESYTDIEPDYKTEEK